MERAKYGVMGDLPQHAHRCKEGTPIAEAQRVHNVAVTMRWDGSGCIRVTDEALDATAASNVPERDHAVLAFIVRGKNVSTKQARPLVRESNLDENRTDDVSQTC